jgi:hypothetical protein
MKTSILLTLALLLGLHVHAQHRTCLTPDPDPSILRKWQQERTASKALRGGTSYPYRSISLFMHIIVEDKTPTSTPAQLQQMVDIANQYFAPVNMHFTICGFDYVFLADNMTGWGPGFINMMADNYDREGYINVYTTFDIPFAAGAATSPSPGSPDQIYLVSYLFSQNFPIQQTGGVFAHELGHIFSLPHTHANLGGPIGTDELVNGTNCATSGDFFCDTPADPNLAAFPGRVDSLCNYTDNINTDANGDLFQPDTRNIMSFSPYSCYDHFSAEQIDQMRFCLDNVRYYLRSGALNMVVNNTERRFCYYDADITLTATPPGGTFSGPGVTGNIFSPSLADGGNHLITYSLPGISDTVSSTDQYATYPDTSLLLSTCAQSFTAGITADLSGISVYLDNPTQQDVTLRIYLGPVGGALLAEDTINVPADVITKWYDLNLDSVLPVTNGNAYTYEIVFSTPTAVHGSFSDRYDMGQGDSLTDFAFVTRIFPYESNCGNNAYIGFTVIHPNKPGFEDFVPEVCVTAPAFTLYGRPSGGDMLINFSPDSVINPAAFGTGLHSVSYSVTDRYGCQSDTMALVNILDDDVTISPLNAIYCEDALATGVSGSPAGGTMYLNGDPLNSGTIDFSTLGPGTHTISYVYRDSLPYFNQIDQSTLDTAFVNSLPVGNDYPVFQSFKAGITGYLNQIYFRWASNDTSQALIRVFAGSDTTGTLLYSDSAGIGGNGYYNTNVWFPRDQIWIYADSSYTFCINAAIPASTPHGNIYLTSSDYYLDGASNYGLLFFPPGRDLQFVTYVDPLYTCANDSVTSTFSISGLPVVSLGNDTTLFIGQTLVLDAGNGGIAYNWSNGFTTQVVSIQTGGTYIVVVTNAYGCTSTDTVVVNFVVGLEDPVSTAFSIQPNPSNGTFSVMNPGAMKVNRLRLLNMQGQLLYTEAPQNTNTVVRIGLTGLPAGIYMLELETPVGTGVKKVVVE